MNCPQSYGEHTDNRSHVGNKNWESQMDGLESGLKRPISEPQSVEDGHKSKALMKFKVSITIQKLKNRRGK